MQQPVAYWPTGRNMPTCFHDDVARHLKQKIADEEERRAKAVGVFAQAQIAHHLQLGEADVLAVDVRDQVADPDERNEPAGDLLDDVGPADARAWRMIHGVSLFRGAVFAGSLFP